MKSSLVLLIITSIVLGLTQGQPWTKCGRMSQVIVSVSISEGLFASSEDYPTIYLSSNDSVLAVVKLTPLPSPGNSLTQMYPAGVYDVCAIEEVSVQAGGSDGWLLEEMSVTAVGYQGGYKQMIAKFGGKPTWIDFPCKCKQVVCDDENICTTVCKDGHICINRVILDMETKPSIPIAEKPAPTNCSEIGQLIVETELIKNFDVQSYEYPTLEITESGPLSRVTSLSIWNQKGEPNLLTKSRYHALFYDLCAIAKIELVASKTNTLSWKSFTIKALPNDQIVYDPLTIAKLSNSNGITLSSHCKDITEQGLPSCADRVTLEKIELPRATLPPPKDSVIVEPKKPQPMPCGHADKVEVKFFTCIGEDAESNDVPTLLINFKNGDIIEHTLSGHLPEMGAASTFQILSWTYHDACDIESVTLLPTGADSWGLEEVELYGFYNGETEPKTIAKVHKPLASLCGYLQSECDYKKFIYSGPCEKAYPLQISAIPVTHDNNNEDTKHKSGTPMWAVIAILVQLGIIVIMGFGILFYVRSRRHAESAPSFHNILDNKDDADAGVGLLELNSSEDDDDVL